MMDSTRPKPIENPSGLDVVPQESQGSQEKPENNGGHTPKEKPRGKGRLIALDAARGLAVIGMFLQHFALNERNASIVSGNTTLLFVLCGGISYSIMARGMKNRGSDIAAFRTRMLARAVFIDVVGYLLILLNAPFGVILPAYAGLFVMALVLVHRSTKVIFGTAAALFLACPPVMMMGMSLLKGAWFLADIAGGPMSAVALAPAFAAGMAIGRLDLTKKRIALQIAGVGAAMLAAGKILAAYVLPDLRQSFEQWLVTIQGTAPAQPDPYAIWPYNTETPLWHMLLWDAPHSASTFQTLIGLGAACLVLGLVFLIPKNISAVLTPFAAVGRVALTLYAAQFVVIWILGLSGIDPGLGGLPFGDLLVAAVTLAAGWLITRFAAGPLETLMRRFDKLFSAETAAARQT